MAVLDLALDSPVDLRDVKREEDRRDGGPLREACRHADGLAVLSIDTHDNLLVSHEAVGPLNEAFI